MSTVFGNFVLHECCILYYRFFKRRVQPDELCAGNVDRNNNGKTDKGADSCKGDSGGPLICKHTNQDGDEMPVLTGVVSWGWGCGFEGAPGIYSDVLNHYDWIKQHVNIPRTRYGSDPVTEDTFTSKGVMGHRP